MGELLKSKHKITGYFQTKKKVEWVNVPVVDSVSRKFYDDCMVERINEVQCIGKHCASKKLELINRLEAERVKHSNLEKALSSCLFMIEEKNKKIAQLQGKSSASVQSKSLPKTPQRASLQSLPKTPTSPTFVSYEKYFTKQQLVKLRSFGNKMCDDSPFILLVMRSLYDDLNELKGVSVTGVSRKGPPKKPISPVKFDVIKGVFEERLISLCLGTTERDLRAKRLNTLMKSAISNIQKQCDRNVQGFSIDTPEEQTAKGNTTNEA